MTPGIRNRLRMVLLLVPLAGAGWLALFGDKTPSGEPTARATRTNGHEPPPRGAALPRTTHAAANARQTAQATGAIEALVPRQKLLPSAGSPRRDLFASPPPPPVPAVAPVQVATAPPLPFRFIGKKLESGVWEVFLGRDEASFVVRTGSLLESNYRVERIEPPSMVLTHLPTRQAQTLAIGDAW